GGQALRAPYHAILERSGLADKVFGEKAAKPRLPFVSTGRGATSDQSTAGGKGEETQIRRSACKRRFYAAGGKPALDEAGRFLKIVQRRLEASSRVAESRLVGLADGFDILAQFGDEAMHMLAARLRQFAGHKVNRLYAVGALVDRCD